jgi:nucleoside phosphorylase
LRLLGILVVVLGLVPVVAGRGAAGAATPGATTPSAARCPILILSAMPLEGAPILAKARVNPQPAWVHDGKGFWEGTLEGNQVVIALTGIGMVNATNTTEAAFDHFRCFSLVVFSGTSGGDYIGDVLAPSHWTQNGKTFVDTSSSALSVLQGVLADPPTLEQTTPAGDPFCTCVVAGFPSVTTPITVTHKPQIEVGGDAASNDGFGGRALPCTPAADDVFGCWPCKFPDVAASRQAENLVQTVPPFADPAFFIDYESNSAPPPGRYVSEDMETAAAFQVAAGHGTPVIGFRAASDGGGDPLNLPGFPAEFFVYRQLAADNAAATAIAFLRAWHNA